MRERGTRSRSRLPLLGLGLATAAVGVATVTLGANGVDLAVDPVSAAPNRVSAAAAKTAKTGGMKFAYTALVSSSERTIRVTGAGTVNARDTGRMTVRSVDLDRRTSTTTVTNAQMVFLREGPDLALYTKASPLPLGTPAGKLWAKQTIFNGAREPSFKLVGGSGLATSALAVLRSASRGLRVTGHPRVRGIKTKRYHATLDLAKITTRHPDVRSALKMLVSELGTKRFTVDAWIDKAGLVRRERMRYTTPGAFPRPAAKNDLVVTFYGFGTKVSAKKPAASVVFDGGSVTP